VPGRVAYGPLAAHGPDRGARPRVIHSRETGLSPWPVDRARSVTMSVNMLRLRSPADVVSAIPYLIGFHPSDSVVVLACDDAQGAYAVRLDLSAQDALLEHIAELTVRRRPQAVILAGYGAAGRVTPMIDRVRDLLQARGVRPREVLRVEDGRFWSYLCTEVRAVRRRARTSTWRRTR
jgi:hypothetical protein